MNKHPLLTGLLLAVASMASLEAVSPEADPPELGCRAVEPCTGPQFVALPTDGPDGGTDPEPPPIAQMVEASGPVHLVIDAPISVDTIATQSI
jgi:hypothetical protein